MPSRSGTNSTRRSAALVVWRFSMLTGWWRSRHARALARNRDGTSSPAGQPRAGLAASGSRKCASSPAAPAGSREAGFVDEDPGVLPGDRPGPQRRQGQRQPRCQYPGVGQQGCGGAFADGQDTGDLGDHGHLLCRLFLRGRRRRRQEPGRLRVVGGQLDLQRRGPGLQPGDLGEPVQATVRQIPQRISIRQGIGAGRMRCWADQVVAPAPVTAASAAADAATAARASCSPHGCCVALHQAYEVALTIMMERTWIGSRGQVSAGGFVAAIDPGEVGRSAYFLIS